MTPQDVVTAVKAAEPKILAQVVVNKTPTAILPTGQSIWCEKQITDASQIMVGMVLVRVLGPDQNRESVIVTSEVFEKRPGSYWYSAIPFGRMDTVYQYSLSDAGVTQGPGGWSQNHLIDSGFTVEETELNQLIAQAKPFP